VITVRGIKEQMIACRRFTGTRCWPLRKVREEERKRESEVRMCLLSQEGEHLADRQMCKRLLFFSLLVRGRKKTGRLTTVSKREEHKRFGTVVKQEGDQMERRPAGDKEHHHGGHHSYCTLLPPENKRHFYCYRHVNRGVPIKQHFFCTSLPRSCEQRATMLLHHVIQCWQWKHLLNRPFKSSVWFPELYGQTKSVFCCLLSKSLGSDHMGIHAALLAQGPSAF